MADIGSNRRPDAHNGAQAPITRRPLAETRTRAATRKDTVTKKDMVEIVAAETGYKRPVVKAVVQCLLDQISSQLAEGHRIEFRDHLVLETKVRASRVAQNPKTLKPVPVPAKRTVRFKQGRLMRERIEAVDAERSAGASPRPTLVHEHTAEPASARNGTAAHAASHIESKPTRQPAPAHVPS